MPAIYADDNYGSWQSNFRNVLAECQELPGERGEIARLLAPDQDALTLFKPRHSAFFSTPLDMLLRGMGVKNLVLTGLVNDMCVHFTAVDAFMRGNRLWDPGNCVAAETATAKRTALKHMGRTLCCSIRSSRGRSSFTTSSPHVQRSANANANANKPG